MQFQSDIIGRPVLQNMSTDASALGAAYFAGLATGWWHSLAEIMQLPRPQTSFEPLMSIQERDALYTGWQTAIARATLDGT
jgi:glycerol kinase